MQVAVLSNSAESACLDKAQNADIRRTDSGSGHLRWNPGLLTALSG